MSHSVEHLRTIDEGRSQVYRVAEVLRIWSKCQTHHREIVKNLSSLPNKSPNSFEEIVAKSWVAWILTAYLDDLLEVSDGCIYDRENPFPDGDEDSHNAAHQKLVLLQFRRLGLLLYQIEQML